jgi:hypothetical protein
MSNPYAHYSNGERDIAFLEDTSMVLRMSQESIIPKDAVLFMEITNGKQYQSLIWNSNKEFHLFFLKAGKYCYKFKDENGKTLARGNILIVPNIK